MTHFMGNQGIVVRYIPTYRQSAGLLALTTARPTLRAAFEANEAKFEALRHSFLERDMIEVSRPFILVPHGCSCKISYIFSIMENIFEVLIVQSPQMFDSLRQRNWQQDCRIVAQVPDTRCSGSKLLTIEECLCL